MDSTQLTTLCHLPKLRFPTAAYPSKWHHDPYQSPELPLLKCSPLEDNQGSVGSRSGPAPLPHSHTKCPQDSRKRPPSSPAVPHPDTLSPSPSQATEFFLTHNMITSFTCCKFFIFHTAFEIKLRLPSSAPKTLQPKVPPCTAVSPVQATTVNDLTTFQTPNTHYYGIVYYCDF